ncbi:MAG: exodeoxyribonuclease VII large subunit [Clostridiales bacterium]|nr:exodeoxyribonuclease VII large subunit [Clostridiales bacterium]
MIKDKALTVTQLSALIQNTLSLEPLLKSLWVRGEITNFKRHSSGHLYFSLKDKDTVIRAVMFRGHAEKLKFRPGDGKDCFFRGYVALYNRETQLQFYVEEIEEAGLGSEALALEELKKKLAAKGYFDQSAKKAMPLLPTAVGVISSPTGAVIQDIQKVLWRRYPGMPILLYPSAVQGREAVESIVRGFAAMEGAEVSVVILARGGGSTEDLSAFNREEVVEAIHSCAKPVISAIGHETDVTLADLAADLRVATPSMAAEMAVPVKAELLALAALQKERLDAGLSRDLQRRRDRLARLSNSFVFTEPKQFFQSRRERLSQLKDSYVFLQPQRLLDPQRDRLSRYQEKMTERIGFMLSDRKNRFGQEVARLEALSPLATLARGYAICRDKEGHVIYDSAQVETGQEVAVYLSKGGMICRVEDIGLHGIQEGHKPPGLPTRYDKPGG